MHDAAPVYVPEPIQRNSSDVNARPTVHLVVIQHPTSPSQRNGFLPSPTQPSWKDTEEDPYQSGGLALHPYQPI